jgi:hypothetical protein
MPQVGFEPTTSSVSAEHNSLPRPLGHSDWQLLVVMSYKWSMNPVSNPNLASNHQHITIFMTRGSIVDCFFLLSAHNGSKFLKGSYTGGSRGPAVNVGGQVSYQALIPLQVLGSDRWERPSYFIPKQAPSEGAWQNTQSSKGRFWMECKRVEDRHKQAGSYTELDSGRSHKGRINWREWNVNTNRRMCLSICI